jgi:hypothetical protein
MSKINHLKVFSMQDNVADDVRGVLMCHVMIKC